MAIPDVSADDIVAALREFDNAKRDTDAWRGWETRRNHMYAISWNGRLYPVKETIRSATGGFSEFGGGAQANRYLRERGFEIVPLRRGDLAISPDGLSRLDCALDRFAEFRRVDEPRYLADERTYKVDLFDHLRKIWDKLYEDPEESKQELVGLMRGEGVDSRLVAAIDNLLGGRGFATRDDFAIYLENINDDEYVRIMGDLFEGDGAPSARLDEFRKSVNGAYTHLYDEGKFHSGKKTRPLLQQCFAAILLASYDPDSYILYRYTEYKKTAEWIGLTVPSTPEQCYTLYLDMAMYILDRAREGNWPVWDLVDVHNMIYMLWRYDEFKDLLTEDERVVSGESVYTFIRKHHFIFRDWLVTDYILSLATKPFVILSGISGTGKTKLGQLVAEYVVRATGGRAKKAFVSVRPDWTDNSYLLGWYNAIAERYETTAVLDLILEAPGEPEVPHFIILDEMNIAKVEHYFSDFLSAMESRWIDAGGKVHQEPIRLHNQGDEGEWGPGPGVPSEIALPLNVYVTGTVNVDESTYMFSPKVFDRANVIEFNDVCLDPDLYRQMEIPGSEGFVLRSDADLAEILGPHKPASPKKLVEMKEVMPEQHRLLLAVHNALRPYNMHFGYRVANEIAAYMLNAREFCEGGDEVLPFAFDIQVLQKILPKLHGNAAQLFEPMESLYAALPDSCSMSRAKLARMKMRLEQVGFASFIE